MNICFRISIPALVAALAAQPAVAQSMSIECSHEREERSELRPGGGASPRLENDFFDYRGTYRVDAAARTVTANFTWDSENTSAQPVSRFISDVRAIDSKQLVFCEDEINGCRKKETDTGRASGWIVISPTIIDLSNMTISWSKRSAYSASRASLSTEAYVSGTCRLLD